MALCMADLARIGSLAFALSFPEQPGVWPKEGPLLAVRQPSHSSLEVGPLTEVSTEEGTRSCRAANSHCAFQDGLIAITSRWTPRYNGSE